MPEYTVIINDPDTYPEYAFNEVIVSSEVYDVSLLSPLHNVDIGPQIAGYNRMRITTKYLDMTSRKPASAYHGPLATVVDYNSTSRRTLSRGNMNNLTSPELSRRALSLSSRVKTRGKSKSKSLSYTEWNDGYQPKKGERCRPGYRNRS